MSPEGKHDAVVQAIVATPAAVAVWTWLSGLTVEKSLGLCGMAFLLLQAAGYVWRWRRDVKRERERLRMGRPPPITDRADL